MLLISLVLGTCAFALSLSVVSSYVKSELVVVAVKDLDAYCRIGATDVGLREVPVRAIPRGCIKRLNDAVGSYTRGRLVAGQILQEGHVAGDKAEAGLSYDLPIEYRGMFLPLSAGRAVGGQVREGERVDLIVAAKAFSSAGGPANGAATPIRGLHVLDVVRDPSSGEFLGIVVLALPQQCEAIARDLEEGSVYVSLVPRLAPPEEGRLEVWPPR
jgi:Flp pilus assembly protein CpaB